MPNELASGRGRGVIDRYRAYLPVSAIPEGCRIVCTVTGHGLKDPGVIVTTSDAAVQPNESAVRRALEKRWS